MIQEPLHYGWRFYKSCNCGGNYQEWFKKGLMTLKIFPNNNRYEVINSGQKRNWGTINELKSYLAEVVSI